MKKWAIKRAKYPILVVCLLFCLSVLHSEEKPIVTVMDFETSNISAGDMKLIISLISSHLFQADQFTVIDVAQRDTILEEIKFSLSGCSDESCQIEIGKLLSAEFIIVGSIGKLGNRYALSMRLLDVSTSKTMNTADGVFADIDLLVEGLEPLVFSLAGLEGEADAASAAQGAEVDEPVGGEPADRKASGRTVAAVSTLATGVIAGGVGGVFLYLAIQHLQGPVDDAWLAYDTATAGDDINGLYTLYLDEFDAFKMRFIIGAAGIGGGLILMGTSIALFGAPEKSDEEASVAFGLYPTARGVSFQVRIGW